MEPCDRPALWPQYGNCIANLPNSILRAFGVEPAGDTLPLLDPYLENEYKNVVVLLLDGMGVNILEANTDPDGFFRSHLAGTYYSTFPPTTVAALTSLYSGLMPCEHAWLGWDCYYPQIDKNVTVFRNLEQDTENPAAPYPVAETYTGYESVFERFAAAGKQAFQASPYADPYPSTLEQVLERVKSLCGKPGRKYVCAYWVEPDTVMHRTGCFSRSSRRELKKIEKQVKTLCADLTDTLFLVTADHGHLNAKGIPLTAYPELTDCLVRPQSIEARAVNFFVKSDRRAFFAEAFKNRFGDSFLLLSKEEVLERKLFGTGKEHPCFRGMLGDYLAVATGTDALFPTEESAGRFIGMHAGLTPEEMRIPLIRIVCPE